MPYHVDVEQRNTEAVVVLVEHTFKFIVQQDFTLAKAGTSPGIKGTSLELFAALETTHNSWSDNITSTIE